MGMPQLNQIWISGPTVEWEKEGEREEEQRELVDGFVGFKWGAVLVFQPVSNNDVMSDRRRPFYLLPLRDKAID